MAQGKSAIPAVTIAVKVVPRAAATAVVGWQDGVLRVRVMEPPQDGRANAAVEALLASELGLKKSAVRVVSGHAAVRKRVAVVGLDRAAIEKALRR